MFSGKPRRAVNLGSKRQSSTHDVLRNAELQRQKREKLRKEFTAANSIQSFWRGTQSLNKARLGFGHRVLNDIQQGVFQFKYPEEFAWVLPVISQLNDDEQTLITEAFLQSPASAQYSNLVMERLPYIWTVDNLHLHALGLRVLRRQHPPSIPLSVLISLLNANLDESTLTWIVERDPEHFFEAVSKLNKPQIISGLPDSALHAFYTLKEVPHSLNSESRKIVSILLKRIVPHINESWQFVFALIMAIDERKIPNEFAFTPLLCDKNVIRMSLDQSSMTLARYIMALIHLYPASKSSVLLVLTLAARPSPLTLFWRSFKTSEGSTDQEVLLNIATELYSYWLLVATDAELVNNASLGLDYEDLWDFATTIRDRSFNVLWNYEPNKRVTVSNSVASTLKLLRQLYTRDSRMHLFPQGFWLMDGISNTEFIKVLENSSSLDGMDNMEDIDSEDEDEEEDDIHEETGGNADTTNGNHHPDASIRQKKITLNASPARRVLDFAPFFVAFETRVALFYKFIEKDRFNQPLLYRRQHFDINRETLVEDSQLLFASLGSRVKTELQVRLLSNGTPEAGVDGGGLTRELLMLICEEMFNKEPTNAAIQNNNSQQPCFVETINNTLAPNPVFGESPALMTPPIKAKFLFLGQVVGKCLYENLLVNVEFASFFLAKWNKSSSNGYAIKSSFDDLSLLDEELYKNISKLHNLHGSDVSELGLDFTMLNSQRQVVELKPNGSSIPVDDSNKLEFMREVANYKLNTASRPQTMWFLMGLSQVIKLEWLNMFNPQEVNKLISGESHDFDVDDLMNHIEIYGFSSNSPTIANLWKVLREFRADQRAEFLKFVTSVPKAPLLGFSRLQPNFGIRFAGSDDQRLPTSSTCVNLLKLPEYSSLEILRQKLLYSIESKAGFELS